MSIKNAFIDSIPFKVAVCQAAGLDPGMVRSIKIDLSADSPSTMTLERWISSEEHAEYERLLEDYILVRREPDNAR